VRRRPPGFLSGGSTPRASGSRGLFAARFFGERRRASFEAVRSIVFRRRGTPAFAVKAEASAEESGPRSPRAKRAHGSSVVQARGGMVWSFSTRSRMPRGVSRRRWSSVLRKRGDHRGHASRAEYGKARSGSCRSSRGLVTVGASVARSPSSPAVSWRGGCRVGLCRRGMSAPEDVSVAVRR
jgi:hypothetical protein